MSDAINIAKLAHDVLALARSTLIVKMRFMNAALCELAWEQTPDIGFATDMQTLWYDPLSVLRRYRQDKDLVTRDYLHVVLHGVFGHAFVGASINRDVWNLACDLAVEAAISELSLGTISTLRSGEQGSVLQKCADLLGHKITAERLYRAITDAGWSSEDIALAREAFFSDDHTPWYPWDADGVALSPTSLHSEAEPRWQELSARIKIDLETFSKGQGNEGGALTQNLAEVTRERYDYAAFLRKFATLGEVMRTNDDEFDYVFFTYGLSLYGNMPLIEPLEYKEVKRIREFVIAIDTSGSVSGNLVQTFLNKTYNILQQSESFFSKINVHIIQCDREIQEDVRITSREEFDQYLNDMQLRGFGDTDFRPVFDYVDKLLCEQAFTNLRGLIYFTDGYGIFPERKPGYETAFVFVDDTYEIPEVPVWAVKLVLLPEEL